MTTQQVDALVIGAGPGGYVAAIRLAQLGVKTMVVDKANVGGVCLNVGCIPSKALINAAKTFEKAKNASHMGVMVESVHLDFAKLQDWKGGVVKKLTGGVAQLLKGNGAEHVAGTARLVGPAKNGVHQVEISAADGGKRIVEARNVVLATGSRPIEIPGFAFGGPIMSSTEALALQAVPERLLVIGGGYIGLELGSAYAKLGADVTVVEGTESLLPGVDRELVTVVERKLKAKGVKVHTKAKAVKAEVVGDRARVTVELDGKPEVLEVDRVLVTVGRRPNSENLGLEAAGVKVERGFVPVDAQQRTNVPGIYAIGDLAGQPMLAHKASMEAEVAAEVIAGKNAKFDARAIPAVIFTDPEIATAGLSPAEAQAQGRQVLTGKFLFAASGRALTTGETDGFVKVVVDAGTHEVLGFGIVGPQASDLVAEATLAIEMGAFVDDIGLTIHAHPTLPEAIQEAVKAAVGEAVHALNQPVGAAKK